MTRCHASVTISVETRLMRGNPSAEAGPILVVDDDPKIAHLVRAYLDRERHEVLRRGERLALSALEFRLLVALVEAEGRVLSRDALLDALYGAADGEAVDRTIDVYVRRLRERLGDAPDRPRYVATVRGIGYRALVS